MSHDMTATPCNVTPEAAVGSRPRTPSEVPPGLELPEFIGAGLVERFAPLSAVRSSGRVLSPLTAAEAAGSSVRAHAEVPGRCPKCLGYGWSWVEAVRRREAAGLAPPSRLLARVNVAQRLSVLDGDLEDISEYE